MNRGFSVTFNKDGLFVLLTSFFSKAGFTRILRLKREPASPQAATMEFSTISFKLISALRPPPWTVSQPEYFHLRADKGNNSGLYPQIEKLLLLGQNLFPTLTYPPPIAVLHYSWLESHIGNNSRQMIVFHHT